jgi:hypothetical protein
MERPVSSNSASIYSTTFYRFGYCAARFGVMGAVVKATSTSQRFKVTEYAVQCFLRIPNTHGTNPRGVYQQPTGWPQH